MDQHLTRAEPEPPTGTQIFNSAGAREQFAKWAEERGEEEGRLPPPTQDSSARRAVHGEPQMRGGRAQIV